MKSYRSVLIENEKFALTNNKEDSAIKILLLHFSNLSSSELFSKLDNEIPRDVINSFEKAVNLYVVENIPVQYITGYEYFYGYKFSVNKNVLIPRNETEELVSNVLMMYDDVFNGEKVELVDVGTGSGCLAVTLAKEVSTMDVTATDISKDALDVAKENAYKLGVSVDFIQGDMLEPLKGRKFDILVSNPPYIPQTEYVDSIVKDNEPHVALYGGMDGMYFYNIILSNAKEILNEKFFIAFEHAYDKAQDIRTLAIENFPDTEIFTIKDMQKKDRMTFIVKK